MENEPTKTELTIRVMEDFLEEYKINKTKDDFLLRTVTLLIASLGLVTALAWEEAIKEIFISIFGELHDIGHKVLYALIVTLIAVIVSIILGKIITRKKD